MIKKREGCLYRGKGRWFKYVTVANFIYTYEHITEQ